MKSLAQPYRDEHVSESTFSSFLTVLESLCGFAISNTRADFLKSRLPHRVRETQSIDAEHYLRILRGMPQAHPEWQYWINVITVSKTSFFREAEHFEFLKHTFLPEWEKKNQRELRVWSAGCSTGEEPYTLAMVLERALGGRRPYQIIATDVDSASLEAARKGVYPREKLAEVPSEYHLGGFAFGTEEIANWIKVRDSLRRKVTFQQLNFLALPYPWQSHFDLIVCRNVLIYLEQAVAERVIRGLKQSALPGAHLLIGYSESLLGNVAGWTFRQPSVYVRGEGETPGPVEMPSQAPPQVLELQVSTSTGPDVSRPAGRAKTGATTRKKRVLIVEDSKTIRKLLTSILSGDPQLEVVGSASNPIEAQPLIHSLHPDVMTMDIMMPVMDGITFLKRYLPQHPVPVVMLSSISVDEGTRVLKALELGAVDYIEKPAVSDFASFAPLICEKVRMAASAKVRIWTGEGAAPKLATTAKLDRRVLHLDRFILVGASTGGTEAIREILTQLPAKIPPMVIVQHLPPQYSTAFAQRLDEVCPFTVKEAQTGDRLEHNHVFVAPGGYQLAVVEKNGAHLLELRDDPPVDHHKPAINYFFHTAAGLLKERALGVLLTGMGADGASGLLELRRVGARTVAQDEATSVVYGMPKEAVRLDAAEKVAALEDIAAVLIDWLTKSI